jgi:hypothetical protein
VDLRMNGQAFVAELIGHDCPRSQNDYDDTLASVGASP